MPAIAFGDGRPRHNPPRFDGKPSSAIKEWVADEEPDADWFDQVQQPDQKHRDEFDQRSHWEPEEITLDDDRVLVLDEG